jgi:hypothetical protein
MYDVIYNFVALASLDRPSTFNLCLIDTTVSGSIPNSELFWASAAKKASSLRDEIGMIEMKLSDL